MFHVLKKKGSIPFYFVLILNAFVDLGHKITIQNIIFKTYSGSEQVVLTALVNSLIILPYVIGFSLAGKINNHFPKPYVIRSVAWGALFFSIVLLVLYFYKQFWFAFCLTFFLAVQSAIYSPAKLSYLKTLFGEKNITAANGLAQSAVILAILFSTLFFSIGFELIYQANLQNIAIDAIEKEFLIQWMAPLACILILFSVLQIIFAYRIPVKNEGEGLSERKEKTKEFTYIETASISDILRKFGMKEAFIGLGLFWAVGQGLLAVFPAYAKDVADITNVVVIQGIMACTAIGIIIGSSLASKFDNKIIPVNAVFYGLIFMIIGLFALLFTRSELIFVMIYLLLGVASGLLIVPLNAYVQMKSPIEKIGSYISTKNLFENIAMLTMLGLTISISLFGVKSYWLLVFMAVLVTLFSIVIWPRMLIIKDDIP